MTDSIKPTRLSKAAREFNVGLQTIVDFLHKKGHDIEAKPNTKISPEIYEILLREYASEKSVKEESQKIGLEYTKHETISIEDTKKEESESDLEMESEQEDLFIKGMTVDYKAREEEPAAVTEKETVPEKAESEEIPEEKEKVEVQAEEPPVQEEQAETVESEVSETPEEKAAEAETEAPAEAKAEVKAEVEAEVKEEVQPEAKEEAKEEKPAEEPATETKAAAEVIEEQEDGGVKILDKIDLDSMNLRTKPKRKTKEEREKEAEARKKQKAEGRKKKAEVPKKAAEEKAETKEEVSQTSSVQKEEAPAKEKVAAREEKPAEDKKEPKKEPDNFIPTKIEKLTGPKILDKIVLPEKKKVEKKPVASSKDDKVQLKKKKRRRIPNEGQAGEGGKQQQGNQQQKQQGQGGQRQRPQKPRRKQREESKQEVSSEEIQKQIKETLARLSPTGKSKASKYRKQKRAAISQKSIEEEIKKEEDQKLLKVTEFVTANELAAMMSISVNDIISTCMTLGMFVSINQRLDAETLSLVAEEFGYTVEFVSAEVTEAINVVEEEDHEDDLSERAPIVTVMGHVDHGKTKLLDYIRNANVVDGEAGGITQHIGAYEVNLENGKKIAFLDTPGHEAFTAMRARGAKVTDLAIIVIAADDNVMPQTKEAINHAQAAGVPIVFAINKIDKPTANADRIKEELANMNILVEDWGGSYQSQEISAKAGIGINELLDKVLLEAEMLELKGNPDRPAMGTVIESSLDKGRGYVAKVMVQNGTMRIGDIVLAGSTMGRVKAMYNERNQVMTEAGPSTPALMLGLNGAPQAGDGFNVMKDEKEAKSIANRRMQLQREQGLRTQKHITLDEIGRRIAIGDFKELNVIVKGDVDGSVEALSDSILKLSTDEVQVNVILKAVGAVTETDVLLASASDAVIIGFQVRPTPGARKLAETEQIDIRLYSIIYQAIEELKSAIEGMLSPKIEEKITGNLEIRETYKITKVGTIAGCFMLDGKINRNTKVRIIRDGIVVYTGELASLKRFKDDVKEVLAGQECGLNIENFNDIKVGDIIEGYEEFEIKRSL